VWLKIGVQSFCIDGYQDTKEEAEWIRKMLAKALMNFLLDTDKLKPPNPACSAAGVESEVCECCDGTGSISYNPNLNHLRAQKASSSATCYAAFTAIAAVIAIAAFWSADGQEDWKIIGTLGVLMQVAGYFLCQLIWWRINKLHNADIRHASQ
jgi:hypothetical protein